MAASCGQFVKVGLSRGVLWARKKQAIKLEQLMNKTNFTCVLIFAIILLKLVPTTGLQVDFLEDQFKSLADHHYQAAPGAPVFELGIDSSNDESDPDELGKIMASSNRLWSNIDNNNSNAYDDHSNSTDINNLIKTTHNQNQVQQQHWQQLVDPTLSNNSTPPTIDNDIASNWSTLEGLGERNHRASIVQTEFGDHAESSELDNQFFSMLGTNNNNHNSNQSADLTLDSEKYNVAPTISTISTATSRNMAEQFGPSKAPLGSGRRQNYTQNANNIEQLLHEQGRANSSEPTKEQQQQRQSE